METDHLVTSQPEKLFRDPNCYKNNTYLYQYYTNNSCFTSNNNNKQNYQQTNNVVLNTVTDAPTCGLPSGLEVDPLVFDFDIYLDNAPLKVKVEVG